MLLEKSVGRPSFTHSNSTLKRPIPSRLQTPWRQEVLRELKISFKYQGTLGDWLDDWISVESSMKQQKK